MKYKVVFSGEVAEGKVVEEVKAEVRRVFRLDEATGEKLFSGQKVVIKANADHETALKFQQSMERCGGVSQIEDMSAPSVPDEPSAVEPEEAVETTEAVEEIDAAETADESEAEVEEESEPEAVAEPEEDVEAEAAEEDEAVEEPEVAPEQSESLMAAVEEERIESGTPSDYDFSIKAVISEAWQLTSGAKGSMFAGYCMVLLVSMGLGAFFGVLQFLAGKAGIPATAFAIAGQLTISVATYPLIAGLAMIGVYRASGLPVSYKMVFKFFGYAIPIIIVNVLVVILVLLGSILLVLPGIYLGVAYALAVPLVIGKNMGAWQAMEASRRAIGRHWFKVFGLYLVMVLIFMVSIIPMGLGLIWTMPMFYILNGILYRTIFGKIDADIA
ncbi:MAG: DUF975 family protein [Desulfobulbaceae bacterium]|nr:DUF975 family protein [Desulfobulbaceae bacterium]